MTERDPDIAYFTVTTRPKYPTTTPIPNHFNPLFLA